MMMTIHSMTSTMSGMRPFSISRVRTRCNQLLMLGLMVSLGACHGLLDVTDPTKVQDSDIANATGANARRLQVNVLFNTNIAMLALDVALFTDELNVDAPLVATQNQNVR